MPEADTIDERALPLTVASLAEGFGRCGLSRGQTVLVHSSLSSLGWVAGGAVAVIQALLQVLGLPDGQGAHTSGAGTLMMPAHSADNTDPARWQHPPVPAHWQPVIRAHMPAFDPRVTPTRGMGRIAELFRCWPGVLRSEHPIGSFAALGPNARTLLEVHPLEDMFGEGSPLARLYELDGYILLLGVDHGNNTSLHLAEHRADFRGKRTIQEGAAMTVNGARAWVTFERLSYTDDDFAELGLAYEAAQSITVHTVGRASVRLLRQRPLLDWAATWLSANRQAAPEKRPSQGTKDSGSGSPPDLM